jgi:hypothetical protein
MRQKRRTNLTKLKNRRVLMTKQIKKILLVLLLGAVFLPAANVGATLYQETTVYGYDYSDAETVQLDFTIGIFHGYEWNGANDVDVPDEQWIYTYEIYSANTSTVTVNNVTLSGLVVGFEKAGVIGNNTTVNSDAPPDATANWIFTFNGGLAAGDTSDLLYVISSLNPYVSEDALRSGTVDLFGSDTWGSGLLPAPGDMTVDINASRNPVPEPATLLLMGSAMLIGAGRRVVRRKKRK